MITSHRACRKSSQNLWLHSAEHYIHTDIQTYIHTIFSHFIFLCQTRSFTYNFVPHNCFIFSILHHLLRLSFLPRPATTFVAHGPRTHTHTAHTTYHHTTSSHTQLPHTNLLTHGFLVAHANPSPSLFSFLDYPCHLYLYFGCCWKKLTWPRERSKETSRNAKKIDCENTKYRSRRDRSGAQFTVDRP